MMYSKYGKTQIVSIDNDLAVIVEGQGTYLFKDYFVKDWTVKINIPYYEVRSFGYDYRCEVPGPREIIATFNIFSHDLEKNENEKSLLDLRTIKNMSVLELFEEIEKKIKNR